MARKRESITLCVNEADKARLEAIAIKCNCTWGEKPNISKLLSEIASGRLVVVNRAETEAPADSPAESEENATNQKEVNHKGKEAIASIAKGLMDLSSVWFGE